MSTSYIAPKQGRMSLRRAQQLVSRISLTGPWFGKWRFEVRNFNGTSFGGQDFYLQVRAAESCNQTGADAEWGGRKFHISNYATDSEVILTAWKAIHTAIEHEARENFLLDGEALFDPHVDVFDLMVLKKGGLIHQDVREDASEVFQLVEDKTKRPKNELHFGTSYSDFVIDQRAVLDYEESLTSRMGG